MKITSLEQLRELYGEPAKASLLKEVSQLIPPYKKFIQVSPFCALATIGPGGMDCTPRGDHPGFVRVHDNSTLMLPDRRGNNRTDSLSNIVQDPRVALFFMVPGSKTCLRINGTAELTIEKEILASFAVDDKLPRCVIVIKTQAIYFQCGRAVMRARLWEKDAQIDSGTVPKPGEVLAWITDNEFDGRSYDDAWDERAKKSLW